LGQHLAAAVELVGTREFPKIGYLLKLAKGIIDKGADVFGQLGCELRFIVI
jgi:hypothetical protein